MEKKQQLEIKPEGWIQTIVFEGGFYNCGTAENGMGVNLNHEAGGVFTNEDLKKIRNFINYHLKQVKNLPPTQLY